MPCRNTVGGFLDNISVPAYTTILLYRRASRDDANEATSETYANQVIIFKKLYHHSALAK